MCLWLLSVPGRAHLWGQHHAGRPGSSLRQRFPTERCLGVSAATNRIVANVPVGAYCVMDPSNPGRPTYVRLEWRPPERAALAQLDAVRLLASLLDLLWAAASSGLARLCTRFRHGTRTSGSKPNVGARGRAPTESTRAESTPHESRPTSHGRRGDLHGCAASPGGTAPRSTKAIPRCHWHTALSAESLGTPPQDGPRTYDQPRAATLSTGPGTKIGCVQCPVRGGGRESNPPASSRRHTGFEGMSSLRAYGGAPDQRFCLQTPSSNR